MMMMMAVVTITAPQPQTRTPAAVSSSSSSSMAGKPRSQPNFAHIVVDDSLTRDDLLQAQLSEEDAMIKVQKMIHLYCFGFER